MFFAEVAIKIVDTSLFFVGLRSHFANKKATAKFTSNLRGKNELNLCIEDHSKIVAVGHSDLAMPYRSGTVNDLHIVPPQMRLLQFNL